MLNANTDRSEYSELQRNMYEKVQEYTIELVYLL